MGRSMCYAKTEHPGMLSRSLQDLIRLLTKAIRLPAAYPQRIPPEMHPSKQSLIAPYFYITCYLAWR